MLKYVINAIPPSLNQFLGRENVWKYRELKTEWKNLVIYSCRPRPNKPIQRAEVIITYYFPTQGRRDPDNYCGKLILDGLTAAKIIEDDSFKVIDLKLQGRYSKENPRTEIVIREIRK